MWRCGSQSPCKYVHSGGFLLVGRQLQAMNFELDQQLLEEILEHFETGVGFFTFPLWPWTVAVTWDWQRMPASLGREGDFPTWAGRQRSLLCVSRTPYYPPTSCRWQQPVCPWTLFTFSCAKQCMHVALALCLGIPELLASIAEWRCPRHYHRKPPQVDNQIWSLSSSQDRLCDSTSQGTNSSYRPAMASAHA